MARRGIDPHESRFTLCYAQPPYDYVTGTLSLNELEQGPWSHSTYEIETLFTVKTRNHRLYRMSWDIAGHLTLYPLDGQGNALVAKGRRAHG